MFAAWLVDVAYVVKAASGRFKLDYVAARRLIEESCGAPRTFLFNGVDPAYGIAPGLQAFYDMMTDAGMDVRLHPMSTDAAGNSRQRRVDVDFSAHLVWQASLPEVTTLVITTGDQDFVPAVELVQQTLNKRVVLFAYETSVHHDLRAAVSEGWTFEQHRDRLARR